MAGRAHMKGKRSLLALQPWDRVSLAQRSQGVRIFPDRTESKVYFVQAGEGGPIKIGTAADISRRLGQMQTGNPEPLVCVAWVAGGMFEESELQVRFAAHHYRGEWYSPHAELVSFIDSLPSAHHVKNYFFALTSRKGVG